MSGTHGVFQHRSGYFFTILEEDFCEVYKKDGVNEVCRAYITSILEHLTNKQYEATGNDEDIWVFMSLPEMERRMRKACSQRTIHKEIQSMIKDGYLSKRRATGKATMEYKLNLKKIRNALEALPEPQSCNSATYHLANLQDQSSNSARITLQNDKNDLADLQPRIHIDIPVEETKNKEEGTVASFGNDAAPAPENVISYENGLKRKTDPNLKVVKPPHSQDAIANEDDGDFDAGAHELDVIRVLMGDSDDDTPTEKVPAVKLSQSSHVTDTGKGTRPAWVKPALTSKAVTQEKMPEPVPPTDKQQRQQEARRENEIWARIERKLETSFSRSQRKSPKNKRGMERLLEDQIADEKIELALDRLTEWEINNFDLERFHELLPGKTAKHRSSQNGNGQVKAPPIPTDIYTQASLDPERNKRNVDRLKARAAERLAQ